MAVAARQEEEVAEVVGAATAAVDRDSMVTKKIQFGKLICDIFQYQICCHFSEDFFILTFMYPYFYLRIQDHLILATGSGGWSSNGCGASDHLKVVLNDAAERPERCPRAAVRHDEVKGRRNKPTGATVISNYRTTNACGLVF